MGPYRTPLQNLELEELNQFVKKLDPTAKVLIKDDSPLMKFLYFFVRLFNKSFMTSFATTICNRVYVPRAWLGRDLRELLVHEVGGHVRQCRAMGFWIHPWVGFPFYVIFYCILLFPIGLAYWRYWYEREADAVAWAWALRNGKTPNEVRERAKRFAVTVRGWNYLRPWHPTLVFNGFVDRAEEVIKKYEDERGAK